MSHQKGSDTTRKVVAWVALSMGGFSAGPDNDMSWVGGHVGHDQMMAYSEGLTPSNWHLMSVVTFPTGAIWLRYGRS
jgi:hypothetical protein